jgi:hypothetical protein
MWPTKERTKQPVLAEEGEDKCLLDLEAELDKLTVGQEDETTFRQEERTPIRQEERTPIRQEARTTIRQEERTTIRQDDRTSIRQDDADEDNAEESVEEFFIRERSLSVESETLPDSGNREDMQAFVRNFRSFCNKGGVKLSVLKLSFWN